MHTLLKVFFALVSTLTININAYALNDSDLLKDDPLNPLRIFAIYHDDVPESKRSLVAAEYIRPFTTEFESITGRKIHVIFDKNRPPYSNFNYKNEDHKKSIDEWRRLAWLYKKERNDNKEYLVSSNDRILLITNDFINGGPVFGGVGGVANGQPGYAAIASLDFKQVIGHELGHTFNADHEEGEVLYNGWWCETFMFPPLPIRSNCLVFSEENRKRIKEYVDRQY
jgi:hypothetical protein